MGQNRREGGELDYFLLPPPFPQNEWELTVPVHSAGTKGSSLELGQSTPTCSGPIWDWAPRDWAPPPKLLLIAAYLPCLSHISINAQVLEIDFP